MQLLRDYHKAAIQDAGIHFDDSQRHAIAILEQLQITLARNTSFKKFLPPAFSFTKPKQGVYLWGGVGRGKTYLMDLFFVAIPGTKKLRLHFYHFMQHVHQALHSLKGTPDPLKKIAKNLKKEANLLCLDELYIRDIADALLLGRLLQAIIAENIMIVTTSNVPPTDLYLHGLQRNLFLPTISYLTAHLQIVSIENGTDYRLGKSLTTVRYYTPHTLSTQDVFLQLLLEQSKQNISFDTPLLIAGRFIQAKGFSQTCVWFECDSLCTSPRGVLDYIEIAKQFEIVFLSNVPIFTKNSEEQCRRFIMLIDELYDKKIKLIISAVAKPDALYTGNLLHFEFMRTISRLQEMQADSYWLEKKVW